MGREKGTLQLRRAALTPSGDLLPFHTSPRLPSSGERVLMHIHMEGKDTGLVPHLIGWIAECLEALNTPDDDIFEARITFVQRRRQEAVRVQLLLVDKRLQVTQCGTTPDAAIDAALQRVQQALHDARVEKRARAVRSAEDNYTNATTVS